MLGKLLPAVLLAGGALLWPELSWRIDTLKLVMEDVGTLPNVTTFKERQIRFRDILKNCEDTLILEEQGCAILSCDPGRDGWNTVMGAFVDPSPPGAIFQWFYNDPDSTPQPLALEGFEERAVKDFHPLGIEYHEASGTLYVVNHASYGPTIELFDYRPWNGFGRPGARHRRTLKHDAIWTPNSIQALDARHILVTNDHFFRVRDRALPAKLETYGALPGGSVIHIEIPDDDDEDASGSSSNEDLRIETVAQGIPFANGIALLNDTVLAVASTGGRSVRLYDFSQTTTEVNGTARTTVSAALAHEVRGPAMMDNLSVDSDGRLLVAGHPRPKGLTATVAYRVRCNTLSEKARRAAAAAAAAGKKAARGGEQVPLQISEAERLDEAELGALEECERHYDDAGPSWVGELVWDEETGAPGFRELYSGTEFGTSCSASRDVKERVVLIGGLYERGIFVGKY